MKPLLIGQAPGPNTDPEMPLYPVPRSSAGGRLAQVMGLTRYRYLTTFDRVNLLYTFPGKDKNQEDKFPLISARVAARAMRPLLARRTVVLLGRGVANAFGYPASQLDFHDWIHDPSSGMRLAVVPHTSGRSLWYNSEENRAQAREFWDDFLGTVDENLVAFCPTRRQV